ncbi:MAG: T9SS type A sorting domain-containing protein [Bacteroidales bacterium]|nr:T9SS type A sorting domain-containing protein [Bacteroidales bacterium]MCF8336927.1 T9SS type A sorting domain-containing protein [Bacteroidales bacterium]
MNKLKLLFLSCGILIMSFAGYAQEENEAMYNPDEPMPEKYTPDTRIDNMGYWKRMAAEGLVPVQPRTKVPEPERQSTKIHSSRAITDDSEDVPVTEEESTQSENSVFVDPNDSDHALNSNNSTTPGGSVYGANDLKTDDGGETWYGNLEGTGGENDGDPAAAIDLDGRMYNGFIHSTGGQGVAYSEDNGDSWTSVLVGEAPGGFGSLLDKNHLWVDNSPTSPNEGNVYSAWTNFGGDNDNEIEINYSEDGGLNWSEPQEISSEVNAGSHNQGVNIGTGPDGEVFAVWAIYDSWPNDENALAMARSYDGGETWETFRIIEDIRGIRDSETSKDMRVNSFPVMDVDISSGPNRGTIYVTWANIGEPGTNEGPGIDIYMIKSTDDGDTWSDPIRVNQDDPEEENEQYFPWISCDPVTGALNVIFYDDRDVSSSQAEVFVATSNDAGESWEDFRVSDVSFTPSPIPGLASGYMGDYLGIDSYSGWTYPIWTDNRTGTTMSYVSPFLSGPPPNQPWVIYDDHQYNDPQGNDNGEFDYDETGYFTVTLSNIGDEPANDVGVTLSTESSYVTLEDDYENFGDFEVEDTITVENAFEVTADPTIPDGESVEFTLTSVDANDSTFTSSFTSEAHAPALAIGSKSVVETSGDMNGFLDPGEEGTVKVAVSNPGDFTANQVIGTIEALSDEITVLSTVDNLGDLEASESDTAEFNVEVSEEAEEGTAVEMAFEVSSEYHSAQKDFFVNIGIIVEDWESGDFTNFDWQNDSLNPWVIVSDVVYEGAYAAKSADIEDNEESELSIDYGVMNNDSISFYRKVSSESGYDYLKFYIDGELIDQYSGEQDWEKVSYPVMQGEHTFTWAYEKDFTQSGGEDCGWIDFIEFPPAMTTTAFAGTAIETCIGNSVPLAGEATLYNSVEWSTNGSGAFENADTLVTVYNPSQEDYNEGSVTLTLTVVGPTETETSEITVDFFESPEVEAGSDAAVCAVDSIMLDEASGENVSSVEWMTEGDGMFSDSSMMQTTYHPGAADIDSGYVTLKVVGYGMADCENDTSMVTYQIEPMPESSFASDSMEVCSGDTATVELELSGEAPYTVALSNNDTITSDEDTFVHEVIAEQSTMVSILSVTDANGCTSYDTDSMMMNVKPLPEFDLVADTAICHNHEITFDVSAENAASYQWTPGDVTTSEITIDSTGVGMGTITYTALVTGENNCQQEKSVDITFEDCTGIPEQEEAASVEVYPNPNDGSFNFIMQVDSPQKATIQIVNQDGKQVYSLKEISVNREYKKEMDLNHLADGVYFLKVITSGELFTQKIVISR